MACGLLVAAPSYAEVVVNPSRACPDSSDAGVHHASATHAITTGFTAANFDTVGGPIDHVITHTLEQPRRQCVWFSTCTVLCSPASLVC